MDLIGGRTDIRGNCEGKPGARMSGGRITILGRVATLLPRFYIDRMVKSTKLGSEKVKIKDPFYLLLGDVIANIQCCGRLYTSLG